MSAGKIFANNYIPKYVPEDLPWYERDGLLTYIDQLKYKEFISDPDAAVKNTKVINFDMIHAQCWGTPRTHSDNFYQTVREKDVKKMLQKDKKKAVAACIRSDRKDIFVEKKLAFTHFLGEQKWVIAKSLIFYILA